MTYKDPEFASLKLTNAGWTDAVDTVPWDRMMFQFRDRRVLGEYACWVGDDVGFVVAAESEEIADEALQAHQGRLGSPAFRPRPHRGDEARGPSRPPGPPYEQHPRAGPDGRGGRVRAEGRRRRGLRAGRCGRRRKVRASQRHAGFHGQLVLPRRMEERSGDRLVQFLRGRPIAHAYQPDARFAPPQGSRHSLLCRRSIRTLRYGRSAFLPFYRPDSPKGPAGRSSSGTAGGRVFTTRGSRRSIPARSERRTTAPSRPCPSNR